MPPLPPSPAHRSNLQGLGLSGQLPLGAEVWEALSTLRSMNLSRNKLSGYLPRHMSELPALQYLVGLGLFMLRYPVNLILCCCGTR